MEYHIARVQYFYNKLEYLRKGLYPEFGGNIEFELYTFFEVCYHLKDWIKKSEGYNEFSNVEQYINNTACLRICADICNRLKHKQLTDRRSNTHIGHFELQNSIEVGPNPSDARCTILSAEIDTELGKISCFVLAIECMEAWNNYFIINGKNSILAI
ncbi:hypothetical protein HOE22_01695 [Candidatus Woesearchaeota archaeon]|jgi:hypothetical protein|nr:hypothetical protein [Candidatus Woesearchaeota archaeon]